MTKRLFFAAATAPLLLAACVSIPSGPSVAAYPSAGKNFDQFRSEEADCRQYATASIGGADPTQVQTDSTVKSAALGTVIGAAAGAAFGGHNAISAGAGTGLLFGALAGSAAGNQSGYAAQRRYDNAYLQCMYAKGNQVPGAAPARVAVPRYSAPAPQYYYPPPPPPPPGY